MENLRVVRKELSNGLSAILVSVGDQEGMLLPELAKVLGVEQRTIRSHCERHSLDMGATSADVLKELKKQKVVALNSARVNFLPKETVRVLVKLVGTPEALAVYSQLWDTAEAAHAGVPTNVTAATILSVIQHLQGVAEEEKVKRLQADKRAYTAMSRTAHVVSLNRKMDKEIFRKNSAIAELSEKLASVTGNEWATASEWQNVYEVLALLPVLTVTVALKAKAKELGEGTAERQVSFIDRTGRKRTGPVKLFNRKTVLALVSSLRSGV